MLGKTSETTFYGVPVVFRALVSGRRLCGDAQKSSGLVVRVRRSTWINNLVYLSSACRGLMGLVPKHCPALHSPSPNLHAGRREREREGGTQLENMRTTAAHAALLA